jgi:hypothetical protein
MFLYFLKTSLWTPSKTAEKSSSSPRKAGVLPRDFWPSCFSTKFFSDLLPSCKIFLFSLFPFHFAFLHHGLGQSSQIGSEVNRTESEFDTSYARVILMLREDIDSGVGLINPYTCNKNVLAHFQHLRAPKNKSAKNENAGSASSKLTNDGSCHNLCERWTDLVAASLSIKE